MHYLYQVKSNVWLDVRQYCKAICHLCLVRNYQISKFALSLLVKHFSGGKKNAYIDEVMHGIMNIC